ncbi:Hsp20/alpha crystallin family protein [Candidatus Kuenenbacteria bacterium]|nr:Hsp20/alpha crystallin family protein [Candidatus Kuenenbacteria bacterium]
MKFLFQTNRPNDDDGIAESEEVEDGRQPVKSSQQDEWLEEDGQLSVDVYQTKDNIVIKSTIAGVKPEDIDISINNDMITIRGSRHQEFEVDKEDFFYQECYWGNFSRSIILPVEVKTEEIAAELENGVLTITLPKATKSKAINIKVQAK